MDAVEGASIVLSENISTPLNTIASYYGNNAFRAVSFAESITSGAKLYANGQMQVTEFVEQ
jgi:hypothetical protein